jgi:hypothetical protein
MATTSTLPTPEQILERMTLCRVELAELKRLLRAVKAAEKAEQARRAREAGDSRRGGRRHA